MSPAVKRLTAVMSHTTKTFDRFFMGFGKMWNKIHKIQIASLLCMLILWWYFYSSISSVRVSTCTVCVIDLIGVMQYTYSYNFLLIFFQKSLRLMMWWIYRGIQSCSCRAGVSAEFCSNPHQTETFRDVCWGKFQPNSARHRPSGTTEFEDLWSKLYYRC